MADGDNVHKIREPGTAAPFFRRVLECTNLGILVIGKDDRIVWINDNLILMLRIDHPDPIGKLYGDLLPPEVAEIVNPILQRVDDMGLSPLEGVKWSSSEEYALGVYAGALGEWDGEPGYRVLVWQDILLYQDLNDLSEQLRQKSKAMSFASHQIKNPLTSVLGFAQLLLSKDPPPEQRKFLERILRGGNQINRLVDEVREVSKSKTGTLRPGKPRAIVQNVINDVVEDFRGRETQRTFEIQLADDFPAIETEENKLLLVFESLVDNACKYSPPSSPIRIQAGLHGESSIHVSVRNLGEGIPKEHIPRIFDCYYRVPNAMTQKTEGAGIGLFIVKKTMEGMGGEVRVDSTPGEETTVTLVLPLPRHSKAENV